MRILATLLQADAGTARVAGFDVVREPAPGPRDDRAHRPVRLGRRRPHRHPEPGADRPTARPARPATPGARAIELLEWFDLAEAAGRPAKTYSGGMRRRLDLAASLVGRPSVIFLDEPTTGLDPAKREDMWDVVRNLVDDGSTVLLTTQYLDEADALADEITVIDHGRVIAHDTPEGLKRVVGGQMLTVRPTDPARLDEVATIIGELAGAAPDSPGRGVLSVRVAGDEVLAAAVNRLGQAGIARHRTVPAPAEPGRGVLHPDRHPAGRDATEEEVA